LEALKDRWHLAQASVKILADDETAAAESPSNRSGCSPDATAR